MASLFLSGVALGLAFCVLLISPAHSLNCTSQSFKNNKLYEKCADLPTHHSYLHYTYNAANSSLSVAFISTPASSDGWIAWAINPTGTGMAGSQALIAFKSDGSLKVKTYNISSYSSVVESRLSFDTWDLSAESGEDGAIIIYGSLKVPVSAEKLNQVWQVGAKVSDGHPVKHAFAPENLDSKGTLTLIKTLSPSSAPSPSPSASVSPTSGGPPLSDGIAARNKKIRLGPVLGITVTGIVMLTILAFCFWKKLLSCNSMIFWKKKTTNYPNIEVFLKKHGSLAPKRYSYSDIKKMTNSFKHKLGQGGFGGVYKGSLLDGRLVAVKILKEAKSTGEEFINEVASISRTSHVNIVTLFGFSFEGNKRALIYEFMPNGSLEKFIYEKNPSERTQKLRWETLYHIAVGIARGLEYLHRGCSTRILHFDIEPHNILLDEDFCPKISDFGLAKICPGRESIISMTGARGTIGYIAPEVFCRNFGNVSQKSDVYSYGMMVSEMAGTRNKQTGVGVCHSSEIYFPHWIYKRLEIDDDLGLHGIENEEDEEYARKMIIVSLWCIQTNPLDRPTMSRVVDMLEGSLGSLQIPPKPYSSSP